ncbi:SDR family NAD(P)-dependent oxidoreductase [Kytococcus sedentarius]|uniref:SDR family NAD(P)-dependent oxidoreductase n=1 Tax=Kytococcus sedentarius TaxID=1276 RepID=UPI001EF22776|nr:SDR family NAD(P)-dependent oxidoreductase [Kytococcus sedentarius]
MVDVTDTQAVRTAAAEAEAALGPVDVVVNNAGAVSGERLTGATDEQIRRTYEVNALAPHWVTRAVLPGMLERRRGLVVTIASLGMFAGVRSRFSPMLPILQPDDVATRVLHAIGSGRERLVLPGHVVPSLALRALPVRVGDAALRALGVQSSMRGFTGRR